MISVLTSDDARSIFTYVFQENLEQGRKITNLKDVLTSFIIAIGAGKDSQRDELTGLATGNYKILVEWGASLVGIFFVSSDWSLEEEAHARARMTHALREIELVYQEEIDQWLGGMGDLSIFRGVGAILGRFFSEYSLVRAKEVEVQELLQHPWNYYLGLTEGVRLFLPIYLESRGYRLFLENQEIAGETVNAIVHELLGGIAPLYLVLKTPFTPHEKIAVLLTHLISRRILNLYQLPVDHVQVFYAKLEAFLTKMKDRKNLGPPANAGYSSREGDCPYFVWMGGQDCLASEGERTGCHGRVFREGDCCEIFLEPIQTKKI